MNHTSSQPTSVNTKGKPRVLLALFCKDWDMVACQDLEKTGQYRFIHYGFDLFSFPSNAQLMWFDVLRFVRKMVKRYGGKIDGVVSFDEQFGALAASLIARELNLPGTDPLAILRAQNKYLFRQLMQQHCPEHNLPFTAFPYTITPNDPIDLPFPFFLKPVKAAFSVLAKRLESREQLHQHLTFAPFEKHIIKRLVRPFNDVLSQLLPQQAQVDGEWLIAEGCGHGEQVNVDGYIYQGQVTVLGVIDELMHAGTNAFARFQYPSGMANDLQQKIHDVARKAVAAIGFDFGFFNLEMFVDRSTGEITVIECNPRMASQLMDFYQRVDGVPGFEMLAAMSCGDAPEAVAPVPVRAKIAASVIWRSFDATSITHAPSAAQLAAVQERFPNAMVHAYPKQGASLAREIKWLGSHRYGVVNLDAQSEHELMQHARQIASMLGWPAPQERTAMESSTHSQSEFAIKTKPLGQN